jgi:hypothetical protein
MQRRDVAELSCSSERYNYTILKGFLLTKGGSWALAGGGVPELDALRLDLLVQSV